MEETWVCERVLGQAVTVPGEDREVWLQVHGRLEIRLSTGTCL